MSTAKHSESDETKTEHKARLPRAATIFGAGVAGLTAAHELVERGFRVEVWEPKPDERVGARGCAVGGMARTQWSAVEWPAQFSEALFTYSPRGKRDDATWWRSARATSIEPIETEFYVAGDKVTRSDDLTPALLTDPLPTTVAPKLKNTLLRPPQGLERGEACVYAECLLTGELTPRDSADPRAKVLEVTRQLLTNMGLGVADGDGDCLKVSDGPKQSNIEVRYFPCPSEEAVPAGTEILLRFRRRERWLPGEHGYRFFPSFYSHLFDTMSRTPLLVPQAKSALNKAQEEAEYRSAGRAGVTPDAYNYVESGRTAYDNLISAEVHALAFDDERAPISFPRYRVGSLSLVLRQWRTAMERFGFSPRDLARYVLRIQEFALMSPRRRARLGRISWWKFVGGEEPDYYTREFKQKIARWAEGLVAMSTEDCDAHTYGAIMLQLISDQYRSDKDYRDGILNGPTSDAWLDPWRRYLEAQGVRFIHGEIRGFEKRDGALWPLVNCFEPRYPGALEGNPELLEGYFVLALPAGKAQELAQQALSLTEAKKIAGDDSDFAALAKLELGDLGKPRPTGMLRHFAGVQFYFPEDLSWAHGHVYYPDAPWGLSSISQVRYWQQKRDWEHGYRGVMSVIIGAWDVRSPETKKTAWESEPHELAQEVWRQLNVALRGPNDSRLGDIDSDEMLEIPNPIYWRLDDGLVPSEETDEGANRPHSGYENATPLLISQAGTWEQRPGTLPLTAPEEDGRDRPPHQEKDGREHLKRKEAYAIFGNVLLCGTYMKTFTRLTTMEAANESARHAVNAILTDSARGGRRPSKLCKIFPLEHREPADFALVKDIDDKFFEIEKNLGIEGGKSMVAALGLDRWTAFIPKRRS